MVLKEQKIKPLIKITLFSEFSNPALQKVLPQLLREPFDGVTEHRSRKGAVMLL